MALATRTTFTATLMCFLLLVNAGPTLRENSLSIRAGSNERYENSVAVNKPINGSYVAANELDGRVVNEPVKFSSTSLTEPSWDTSVNEFTKINSTLSSAQFGRKFVHRVGSRSNSTNYRLRSRYRQDKKHGETLKNSTDEKSDERLLSALSKIAKVRVADHGRGKIEKVSPENVDLQNAVTKGTDDEKISTNTEEFQSESTRENSQTVRSLPKLQKFHCHGIHEVYIPEIESLMPAYTCVFGEKTFVLSSPKFHEDHRSYLSVDIDGEILERLTETAKIANNDLQTKIISALLVLSSDEDNYRIQNSSDI